MLCCLVGSRARAGTNHIEGPAGHRPRPGAWRPTVGSARLAGIDETTEQRLVQVATDELWVVLAGVGAGAFWAPAGVLLGSSTARRR